MQEPQNLALIFLLVLFIAHRVAGLVILMEVLNIALYKGLIRNLHQMRQYNVDFKSLLFSFQLMLLLVESNHFFGQTFYSSGTQVMTLGSCASSTYGTMVQKIPVSALVFNVAVSLNVLLL